jgi:hypothetical protein
MPYAGFELTSKHIGRWVGAIGKFMINFGGIEWTSFVWMESLSRDDLLKEVAADMPLSKRIELIRKLLDQRALPKKLMNEAKSAWGTAEKLAKFRNDIAHNPIVFGWHGPEEARPPDFIGSLNFRKLKARKPQMTPLLEFTALTRAIDEAARVAQELHELLGAINAATIEASQETPRE